MVQLSHLYMTIGKTIALTKWTFVGKEMSLLFNMLSISLYWISLIWTSLVAQRLKCLPGMQETRVRSLGWEDPLEKEMATHSSTLAWRIPWREEPGGLQSMGSQRVGHNWATLLSLLLSILNTKPKIVTIWPFTEELYRLLLWGNEF